MYEWAKRAFQICSYSTLYTYVSPELRSGYLPPCEVCTLHTSLATSYIASLLRLSNQQASSYMKVSPSSSDSLSPYVLIEHALVVSLPLKYTCAMFKNDYFYSGLNRMLLAWSLSNLLLGRILWGDFKRMMICYSSTTGKYSWLISGIWRTLTA